MVTYIIIYVSCHCVIAMEKYNICINLILITQKKLRMLIESEKP